MQFFLLLWNMQLQWRLFVVDWVSGQGWGQREAERQTQARVRTRASQELVCSARLRTILLHSNLLIK